MTPERLEAAYQTALAALLAERTPEGHWVGELSTSALSTATAVMALHLAARETQAPLIAGGLAWLAAHQNTDGGWGDTTLSFSNISTTMLCRAAFYLTNSTSQYAANVQRCEAHLAEKHGKTPNELAEALRRRYGKDRTFAVPILTTCALASLIEWRQVPSLPFELACFPQSWYRLLRLHVVSYALPALIAIGQCIHHHRPTWNPLTRMLRWLARKPSLRVLQKIQPSNGGFLEATPLTSFVTLSLASIGLQEHPVVRKGVEFIVQSVRPDGSWPIDTNLSTWVTTLAVNALAAAGESVTLGQKEELREWLLRQQYRERHPYTGAAPGGWGWTPLPGSVPDADDTPGAVISLQYLGNGPSSEKAITKARDWLFDLRNGDGGIPTFCRGWGQLPFDRSGADLTAHAIRSFADLHTHELNRTKTFWDRQFTLEGPWFYDFLDPAIGYLQTQQLPDGSWLPLWFGNQHTADESNPTYGTAKVLAAYRDLGLMTSEPAQRGVRWLLANQNDDGGWGGGRGTPSSVEETALAVEILVDAGPAAANAVHQGVRWLVEQVEAGTWKQPAPIGFYFAKLWYFEKLYPIIFTVAALGRARLARDVAT